MAATWGAPGLAGCRSAVNQHLDPLSAAGGTHTVSFVRSTCSCPSQYGLLALVMRDDNVKITYKN